MCKKQPKCSLHRGIVNICFFFRSYQHCGIGTITINNICALMYIWSYSTRELYRSQHSYSTLLLKHGGQISVEVTGKRRNKGIGLEIPASYTFYCKEFTKTKRLNSLNRTNKRQRGQSGTVDVVDSVMLTVKLFYCYRIEGFWFLWVCFAFVFCHVLTFVRYIGVYYPFGLLDRLRYNEDFVISRLFPIFIPAQ